LGFFKKFLRPTETLMPLFDLRRVLALSTLALASLAASAAQVDVAGVKLDDAIDLRGSRLLLNGAGVRYKAVFRSIGRPNHDRRSAGARRAPCIQAVCVAGVRQGQAPRPPCPV